MNTQRVEGHTPTPYTLLGGTRIWLIGADEKSVGAIHRPTDADFIMYACNNIERLEKANEALATASNELLEALGEKERYVAESQRGRDAIQRWLKAWDGLREAVALAKEPA